MSDIVERLKRIVVLDEVGSTNPLARDAADTIEALRKQVEELSVDLTIVYMVGHGKGVDQLAAAQAREAQLREALKCYRGNRKPTYHNTDEPEMTADNALALPQDDSSLRQYGAKLLREAAEKIACVYDETEPSRFLVLRMADELEGK